MDPNAQDDTSCSSTSGPYRPLQLTPCRVCGAKSTGYHFGVISCEACKSFFRRSLKRNCSYYCEANNECQLSARGTQCAGCRLKKCIEVGMSTKAVKKGRYSYEKRAEAIMQSKTYWNERCEQELNQQTSNALASNFTVGEGGSPSSSSDSPGTANTQLVTQNPAGTQAQYKTTYGDPGIPIKLEPLKFRKRKHVFILPKPDNKLVRLSDPLPGHRLFAPQIGASNVLENTNEHVLNSVRSINKMREVCIDGKPISHLLQSLHAGISSNTKCDVIQDNEPAPGMSTSYGMDASQSIMIDGTSIFDRLLNEELITCEDVQNNMDNDIGSEVAVNVSVFDLLESLDSSPVQGVSIDGVPIMSLLEEIIQDDTQNGMIPLTVEDAMTDEGSVPSELGLSQAATAAEGNTPGCGLYSSDVETANTLINMANFCSNPSSKNTCEDIDTKQNIASFPYNVQTEGIVSSVDLKDAPHLNIPQFKLTQDVSGVKHEQLESPLPLLSRISQSSETLRLQPLIDRVDSTFKKHAIIERSAMAEIQEIYKRLDKEDASIKVWYDNVATNEELVADLTKEGMQLVDSYAQTMVKIYREIPGFQHLHRNDQISVIKDTVVRIGYFLVYNLYHPAKKLVTLQNSRTILYVPQFSFIPLQLFDSLLEIFQRLQDLTLTDLETALVTSFVMMDSDKCEGREGRQVCQQYSGDYLLAFGIVVRRRLSDERAHNIVMEVMDIIKGIRVLEPFVIEYQDKFTKTYKHLPFSGVMKEMYSLT